MVAGEDPKGETDADVMARANAEAAADAARARRAVETQEAINADDPRDIEEIVAEAAERAAREREQADTYYRDKAARGSGQADQQQKLAAGVPYGPPLFHPDGVTPPIPGGTSAFPPIPAPLPGAGVVQVQQQHIAAGTGTQNINSGGMAVTSYQDQLREKAAAQLVKGHEHAPIAFCSAHTGILQPDGSIKGDANIAGSEVAELDHDVTIQADHLGVHLLWRKWLQKYQLTTIKVIASAASVEGLNDLFRSAQQVESLIICLADRAKIKKFQTTCIYGKDGQCSRKL